MHTSKNTLQIRTRPGVTEDRQLADLATDGVVANAVTARTFLEASQPNVSLSELVASLQDHGKRVSANDLSAAEQMLAAQAIALNAIFAEMARRAALNMGQHLAATESYMRLALKAQGQSRATVETIAAIKNPPVIYAKQANITSGSQQVNNGVPQSNAEHSAHTHAGKRKITPTELLEETSHGRTQMDTRPTTAAVRSDKALEPMAAVHRPAY
ncbi:hypothetical protein [Variovorax sp. PvP013]|uniref:hypothetical protein n=1 Tax=Variovorax sp. PvP013 TaxID=3156435 RepID=UPI003D21AD3E